MHIQEDAVLLMANERMADARRRAEASRALRLAAAPRLSARTRLGRILVGLGYRMMGSSAPLTHQDRCRHAEF